MLKTPLNLSREETIANHRKIWNWIAHETLKRKRKVLKEEYFDEHGINHNNPGWDCYCCDYSRITMKNDFPNYYKHCPLIWGDKLINTCMDIFDNLFYSRNDQGLFAKWNICKNYQEAADLARQIANLPERNEY